MSRKYINLTIFLSLILWPLNLYFANTLSNFVAYVIPALFTGIAYFLYKKYPNYYLVPILIIGLVEKKLVLLAVIFCLAETIMKFRKEVLLFLAASLLIFVFQFPGFKGQTVFNKDYEAEQLILRNIHLYPNPQIARLFQNKPRIYIDKVLFRFFAMTDPNNYFFGFNPRQITVDNQNLYKYPFPALVFLLYGIYHLGKNPNKKFILLSFFGSILTLIVLNNFDRNDFILWIPISLILVHGVNTLYKTNRKLFLLTSIFLVIFAIPQILRSFIEKSS